LEFFNCERISDTGLIDVGSAISALSKIDDLFLNFSSCEGLTSTGLNIFLKYTSKIFSWLSKLHLDFAYCSCFNLDCFEQLTSNFTSPNKFLTEASFDFSKNTSLDD